MNRQISSSDISLRRIGRAHRPACTTPSITAFDHRLQLRRRSAAPPAARAVHGRQPPVGLDRAAAPDHRRAVVTGWANTSGSPEATGNPAISSTVWTDHTGGPNCHFPGEKPTAVCVNRRRNCRIGTRHTGKHPRLLNRDGLGTEFLPGASPGMRTARRSPSDHKPAAQLHCSLSFWWRDRAASIDDKYRQPLCALWRHALTTCIFVEDIVRLLYPARHWSSAARPCCPTATSKFHRLADRYRGVNTALRPVESHAVRRRRSWSMLHLSEAMPRPKPNTVGDQAICRATPRSGLRGSIRHSCYQQRSLRQGIP